MKRKLVLKRKRFTTSDLIKKNNIMHQKILRTAIGTNGEVLKIVSTERSKPFTLKEAVQSRIISVSKKKMLELFTEQELKLMKYDIIKEKFQ